MPVELEVRDGDPWWMSPDIWTVPGTDPVGPAGSPIVGEPCYLWARVANNGKSSVENASVRFYWADPSVGFDRTTAHLIGTSNVNLAAGDATDVLCLTPWVPDFVNGGHECVLAEAFHASLDPLPAVPDFNVPTDRHVAQRNLSVVMAMKAFFALPFTVFNGQRAERRFEIRVRQGRFAELERLGKRWGINVPKKEGKLVQWGLVEARCPSEQLLDKGGNAPQHSISIRGKSSRPLTLIGRVEGGGALVHVAQYHGEKLMGGLSVLVVGESKQ